MYLKLYEISQGYTISRNIEKLYIGTGIFFGYIPGYPISLKTVSFYVPLFFFISQGYPISQKTKICNVPDFLGIPIPIFF